MWLLNNLSSFVKNVIIVKHNTSAIGKTGPSVVLYCFLKYLRECQFFKEIVIFQKSDQFFVLFQTARTLLILTLHWKAMLFWKCLYPYFNFKWVFDVATEVKILLWHTYIYPFPGCRGPQWAVGATRWTICQSSLFQTFGVPVNPGATVYQCHVHLAILRVLGPHLATGATIWITHKWHVGWAIVDLFGPQWALRATIWTTCRSRYFQSFWVLIERWEPLYIKVLAIKRYWPFVWGIHRWIHRTKASDSSAVKSFRKSAQRTAENTNRFGNWAMSYG